MKYNQGQAEQFLQVQKSKRLMIDTDKISEPEMSMEDDRSPLAVKKGNEKKNSEEAETSPSMKQSNTEMVKSSLPGEGMQRKGSYTPVMNGDSAMLKKPDIAKLKISEIFSPKTENDEKIGKSKGANKSFVDFQNKRNLTDRATRTCITENALPDLDPEELEAIKKLEISYDEDVDDPTKIDKIRLELNNAINIMSPVHHAIGGFFKDPAALEGQALNSQVPHKHVKKKHIL